MPSWDSTRLTAEQAYDLVRQYVKSLWFTYKNSLRMDMDDVVQDIMIKLLSKGDNPDYDASWKPGMVLHRKRASGADYKDVDTSYMLDDGYNPDSPYDPIPRMASEKTLSYLDKYDGRRTSKNYYISTIVKNTMSDMATKKDHLQYADSLDRPADDDGDSRNTLGDITGSSEDMDTVVSDMERSELRQIIMKLINRLPNDTIDAKQATKGNRGAVGWSPLTGQLDSSGNHIENLFTLRDAAMHLFFDYSPEEVASFYHKADGSNISPSSVSAKYAQVKSELRNLLSGLSPQDREVLRSAGFQA